MTDSPYEVGFLEDIINVHFGSGPWLGLFVQQDTGASEQEFLEGTITGALPGQSFTFANGGVPTIGGPSTRDLSQDDLKTPYPQTLNFSWQGTDHFGGKHLIQLIVLNISSFKNVFTQTFHVSMPPIPLIGGTTISTTCSNFIWSDKNWKKGAHVSVEFFSFVLPPSDDDNGSAVNLVGPAPQEEITLTFTIDPKKPSIVFNGRTPPF